MKKEIPLTIEDFESCRTLEELRYKYLEKGIFLEDDKELYKMARVHWWNLNRTPHSGPVEELPTEIVEDDEMGITYYVHKVICDSMGHDGEVYYVHGFTLNGAFNVRRDVKDFIRDEIMKYVERNNENGRVRVYLQQGFKKMFGFPDSEHITEMDDWDFVLSIVSEMDRIILKNMYLPEPLMYILSPLLFLFSRSDDLSKIDWEMFKALKRSSKNKDALYDAFNAVKSSILPESLDRDHSERYAPSLFAKAINKRSEYMAKFAAFYSKKLEGEEKEVHVVTGLLYQVDHYLRVITEGNLEDLI